MRKRINALKLGFMIETTTRALAYRPVVRNRSRCVRATSGNKFSDTMSLNCSELSLITFVLGRKFGRKLIHGNCYPL